MLEGEQKIDRWLAQGFWFLEIFVRDHTMHPNFPRKYAQDYYDRAFARTEDLGSWFFTGHYPYLEKKKLEEII